MTILLCLTKNSRKPWMIWKMRIPHLQKRVWNARVVSIFFYSYKKFTTNFTFYYTYLATIQYYRDDAKGSKGQRLPQSLNIKTLNYTLHTTNCTPHTIKGQRILYLILFHIGCQIRVGKKFKESRVQTG